MKQLLILSGKGGTGKTTVAGAFVMLASAKAYADCDVDAPNLHLILQHESLPQKKDYIGMGKATIDNNRCIGCGACQFNCRFEAILYKNNQYHVDEYSCEGCGVCEAICPTKAITMQPDIAGELMLYQDDVLFSTAKLKMGSGTSGKLVTEVKKQLMVANEISELAIIDGSPGIGCPVIASLSGVDMVLLVAEPSLSGISDMQRIITTAQKFRVRVAVCVNKFDTNLENTKHIEKICEEKGLDFVGRIPFDTTVISALNQGKSVIELDCPASKAIKQVYTNTINCDIGK